jgi:hypothetical protein
VLNLSNFANNNFTFSGSFIRAVIHHCILVSVSVHINSFNLSSFNSCHLVDSDCVVSFTIASNCLLSITGLLLDVVPVASQDHLSFLFVSCGYNHGKAAHNLFSFSTFILFVIVLPILFSIESLFHVHAI